MELLFILLFAFTSALLTYFLFRKLSVFLWGFTAALLPDLPIYILSILGATNLGTILIINRFLGLFLWPVFLMVLDLLLIELDLFGYLKPLSLLLPESFKTALKFEVIVEKLQRYNAIPRPTRLKTVYKVGYVSILIYLIMIYTSELLGYSIVSIL